MRSYFTDTNGKAGVPWTGELLSSAVVFMVALPLCIAIAQASGMPAEAGVITGVVGGILVGLISGSPLQVSGPAAGLIVVVADIIKEVGIPGLGVALFLAGCLQVLAGWAKLGQWFRAVSPAVIHGMLAGIGLVILAKQVHILIDDFPGDVPVIENLLSFPGPSTRCSATTTDCIPTTTPLPVSGFWRSPYS